MKKKILFSLGVSLALAFTPIFLNAQNTGIGTNTPTEKLEVIGNVKADTIKVDAIKMLPNAASGRVLVSDSVGNGTWQSAPVGPQGPAGPAGPIGPAGTPGASGIFVSGGAAGFAGTVVASSSVYVFVGPTSTVTTDGTQRIILFGSAPLSTTSGNTIGRLGACYQPITGGTIINFVGFGYSQIEFGTERHAHAVAGSVVPAAGTYTIGIGIRNTGNTALDQNDYVNYSYMVVNQ